MRKTVYSQSQLVIPLATSFDVRDEISRVVLAGWSSLACTIWFSSLWRQFLLKLAFVSLIHKQRVVCVVNMLSSDQR